MLARLGCPLLACAFLCAAAVAAPPRQPGDAVQVLVIGGTDPYLPAFVAIDSAMRTTVARRHGRPVVWLHESIDTARFGAPGPLLAEVLAKKYEQVRVDAVVLVTEPAVDFFLHFGRQLWPAAPAVFHSVAPAYAQQLPPAAGLSGIPAEVDYAGAVGIALSVQPQARRALLVAGTSSFDQMQLDGLRQALAPYAGRLAVEELVGLAPAQLAARLAQEPATTVVLYGSLFRDADGRVYVPRAALADFAAASAAPIYGVFDSYLGHGLTAGAVESFSERGERVADLLIRRLDAAPGAAAVIEPAPPSRCAADGRQLQRFGLDAARLPAGCELRYVEASFLERYGWQSALVALALLAQTLLIASLLLQRRRRRVAELGLQAQRVQLLHAARLAVAGELTASIAHEINQPLGAILANAEAAELLLGAGRMPRDELLQILADIKRDDLRAGQVIQRLRALLARHDTERRRFGLDEVIEATAAILRAEARRRGVAVEYTLKAPGAELSGDPVQIQQVLINLLLNAFDASTGATAAEARRVRVETRQDDANVQIEVRDFGSGIAPADLGQIFDPFFSTKRSGMGLGLAITRTIVEAHGGSISAARCAPGTVLSIRLPLAPAAAAAVTTTMPTP